MATSTEDEGRAATDRATPNDTSSDSNSIAPTADAATNPHAWLISFALGVQRADAALLALFLAGWPR